MPRVKKLSLSEKYIPAETRVADDFPTVETYLIYFAGQLAAHIHIYKPINWDITEPQTPNGPAPRPKYLRAYIKCQDLPLWCAIGRYAKGTWQEGINRISLACDTASREILGHVIPKHEAFTNKQFPVQRRLLTALLVDYYTNPNETIQEKLEKQAFIVERIL